MKFCNVPDGETFRFDERGCHCLLRKQGHRAYMVLAICEQHNNNWFLHEALNFAANVDQVHPNFTVSQGFEDVMYNQFGHTP